MTYLYINALANYNMLLLVEYTLSKEMTLYQIRFANSIALHSVLLTHHDSVVTLLRQTELASNGHFDSTKQN